MDAFQAATNYLEESELIHMANPESRELHAVVSTDSGIANVMILTQEPMLRVIAISGARVPLKARPAVAEFIARAQFNMEFARLDFDYDKGFLAIRTSVMLDPEQGIEPDAVGGIVKTALSCLDHFLPGYLAVAFGGHPPARALAALDENEEVEGEKKKPTIRIQLPPKPRPEDDTTGSDGSKD